MDSVVKDEKKYDQRFEETMKIFEDGGDQCLQKTIKIKKWPPRCHDDDDDDEDEGVCSGEKKAEVINVFKKRSRSRSGHDGAMMMMMMMMRRGRGGVQEKKKLRMKKMMDKARCSSSHATPELPVILRNRIRALGGFDVTFVIQKPLFKTDVSPSHNRLSIPLNQIQQSFLTPEESERLNSGENRKKKVQIWK